MMDAPSEADPLSLAERIATAALDLGIETAVIGALALAAHKYVRATQDVDLATAVDVYPLLRELERKLRGTSLLVELRMPDEDDPLGGVLRVWERVDQDGEPFEPVEVVNFRNPHRVNVTPAESAIRNAVPLDLGSSLRYAQLPDLIALKLYAGGTQDLGDIVAVLKLNPDADLDQIRARSARFDRRGKLEELIAEARNVR